MTTSYEEIDKGLLIRLKDPLVLKFVSSNYLGQKLPNRTLEYTSLSLFEKMLWDMENSYAGKLQGEIVSAIGDYLLNKFLNGIPVSSISTECLKEAYHHEDNELHELATKIYKKDGITIAYAELLNKAERPILRETERIVENTSVSEITFIYERFLEFVMAKAFVIQMRRNINDQTQTIPAQVYLQVLEKQL